MANGLTAAQICTRACGMADTPNYLSQAGDYLNQVLASLARNWDFDLLRKSTTINVVAGQVDSYGRAVYALPADYLRGSSFYYTIQGANLFCDEIPLEMYDRLVLQPTLTANPYYWTSDINASPPNLYLYPVPQQGFTLQMRYRSLPADIPTPSTSATIPWFPNTRYLLYMVAGDLAIGYGGDSEGGNEFLQQAETELNRYMKLFNDDEGFGRQVKLDARYFSIGNVTNPTKKLPL